MALGNVFIKDVDGNIPYDTEVADGGLERGDVTHVAQFEFRPVRLAVPFGEERRL